MFSSSPFGIHASEKQEKATQGSCGLQLNSAGAEDSASGIRQKATVWNSRGCKGQSTWAGSQQQPNEAKVAHGSQQDSKPPKWQSTGVAWKLLEQEWIAVKSSWWDELRCYLGPCARQHWINSFIELVVP